MIMQEVGVIIFPFFLSFLLQFQLWSASTKVKCDCSVFAGKLQLEWEIFPDIPSQLLSFEGCQYFHMEDFQVLDKAF